jgi:hypothetical protein
VRLYLSSIGVTTHSNDETLKTQLREIIKASCDEMWSRRRRGLKPAIVVRRAQDVVRNSGQVEGEGDVGPDWRRAAAEHRSRAELPT